MNALRDGFFALTVLPGESAEEFQILIDGLLAQWNPRGLIEKFLVQEIACNLWRVKRVNRGEGELLMELVMDEAKERRELEESESIEDERGEIIQADLDKAFARCLSARTEKEAYERTQSVQQTLLRSLYRSVVMLRSLQESRSTVDLPTLTLDNG